MLKTYVYDEYNKKYMLNLRAKLRQETDIIPTSNPFKVFNSLDYKKLKVVILGQDPYAAGVVEFGKYKDYYNGTAFGTDCMSTPYSLSVLQAALLGSCKGNYVTNSLSHLIEQGVLPMNTLWSVRRGSPLSHEYKEWYGFTSNLLKYISNNYKNLVFILIGGVAASRKYSIEGDHLIMEEIHPASHGRGGKDFKKTPIFRQANDYLRYHKKEEIRWAL